MASTSGIVVATSIPPNVVRHENGRDVGQEYQRHCIESWIGAGFRVLSLNFPDEIPELAPRYPKVYFIPVSAVLGYKTPTIDHLLGALADQSEDIVGIINADIFLEAKDWIGGIKSAVQGAIAVGYRLDVKSFEDSDPQPYHSGYDLFFLERKAIPGKTNRPFAMGLPWWDYCLPIVFRIRGLRVNLLTSPVAFHLQHPTKYEWPIWRYMAKEFAQFVLESVAASPASIARELSPVVRLCRKVVAEPAVFEDIRPSLLARVWNRLLNSAKRLPGLSRILGGYRGQDANRHRLSRACAAAIFSSNVTTKEKHPVGTIKASMLSP